MLDRLRRTLRIDNLMWLVVGGVSVVFCGLYLYQAARRFHYPYELEWLESGVAGHVQRIIDGNGLYGPPSRDWVPFLYTPLYDYVASAFAVVFGAHFWVLRVISIAASLGIGLLIYKIVNRETQHRGAAIAAVGLYAATYPLTEHWYDLARVDSLFLLLTLAGLYVLRFAKARRAFVVAGVLMAAAALTKQTGLIIAAPLVVYLAVTKRWREGVAYGLGLFVPFFAACAVLELTSDGWFSFWVFELGGEHEYQDGSIENFFTHDITPLWVAIGLSVVAAGVMIRRSSQRWMAGYWLVVSLAAGAAALSSRMHTGGAENVLWPLYLVLAIDFGLAAGVLVKDRRTLVRAGVAVVAAVQLLMLSYSPSESIPSAADRRAGDRFIETLKGYNGDVLVMSHPQYAVMAGSPLQAGHGQIIDVLRAKDAGAKDLLRTSFAEAVHNRTYTAIYLDQPEDAWVLPPDFGDYYQQVSMENYWHGDEFTPVDTAPFRPSILYVLKDS